jgi:hypothetical protein
VSALSSISFDPSELAALSEDDLEAPNTRNEPLILVLAGPMADWWRDGRGDDAARRRYREWRDAVRIACVRDGFLVYSPHRAWQGVWSDGAQRINERTVELADVVLDLTPGDSAPLPPRAPEVQWAVRIGTPVLALPPGDALSLAEAIALLRNFRPRQRSGPVEGAAAAP